MMNVAPERLGLGEPGPDWEGIGLSIEAVAGVGRDDEQNHCSSLNL